MLSLCYRWDCWGIEGSSNLPQVTQLVLVESRYQPKQFGSRVHALNCYTSHSVLIGIWFFFLCCKIMCFNIKQLFMPLSLHFGASHYIFETLFRHNEITKYLLSICLAVVAVIRAVGEIKMNNVEFLSLRIW